MRPGPERDQAIRETTGKILQFIGAFVGDRDAAERIWLEEIPDMLGEAFSDAVQVIAEQNHDQVAEHPRALTYALMTAAFHLGYTAKSTENDQMVLDQLGAIFVGMIRDDGGQGHGSARAHRPRGRRGKR